MTDMNEIIWDHPDPFIHEVTVEPQHIDDFQHTNNVVYLTWMAKTAWEHSKALGLDFASYARLNRGMVVRRHEMEYFAPSHEGDKVLVATWITGNDGRLRLRRRFQMVKASTGATLLRGLSDFVCINIETGKATRMPVEFVETYKLTASVDGDN
ncbi:thioesterase family protein [Parvibaculum sp.]|uniref:acyl-CoA thioesterase n=1 Tax=Parvibaculum sp. TaxID=2024848 RepID=UPI002B68B709|nr:thioesterase family protein [Parvibaculum sp.]HUD53308.1 thioesterase family protein [Parvibaculum sp.]